MYKTIATAEQSGSQQLGERTALMAWTAFVLMFFLMQAVIWTVAISITVSDTSHAVVPNYDQQAMNWDDVKAEKARSAALGWSVQVGRDLPDEFNQRSVTLKVIDRDGMAVVGGVLEARVFHRSRAANAEVVLFQETSDGMYAAEVHTRHVGRWQIDGRLIVGEQVRLINETFQAD